MRSTEVISDRGRGPEIVDTRITVYDVLDYVLEGWEPARIAMFFRIGSRQVDAAIDHIRENKLQVLSDYIQMLEREARGNSPELQARLAASHGKAREFAKRLRRKHNQKVNHARPSGRR
jgi:uncharacterized protein (DUF433 family)